MNRVIVRYTVILLAFVVACQSPKEEDNTQLRSPDGKNSIAFQLTADGIPSYQVEHADATVIETSKMGFDFKDQPAMNDGFEVVNVKQSSFDETWKMPWGEQQTVRNHYNEMSVELAELAAPNRRLNIHFRAYDDGVAFRYELLPQEGVDTVIILDENTEFQLTEDHLAWWIPGDWDIYEHLYNETKVSDIDAISKRDHPNLNASYIPENAVNTPVTMRSATGLHLSFHEANLTDYAGMTLKVDTENLKLTSELVGSDRTNSKVKRALPFKTPWRMIQISEDAAGLIDSRLVLNLNEPNKIGAVDWFEPMKYVGIWWEMHIGESTWDYEATQSMSSLEYGGETMVEEVKHGATTENAKRYIDFAAENDMKGLLVEGWNTGWDRWIGFEDREGVFDFVTAYPDYDLEEVARYGKEKGIQVIMHHETSAAPRAYEQQLDTAFALMQSLGIHSVKTGYVGKIIPKGEYHHGQWMVNHYRKVLDRAAKYQIAINAHEPIKATGIRRTYPNCISREGLRGQEFNAWASDGGNPPNHIATVAFTRMLAGPIDFTPGVFDIGLPTKSENQINTTLAHQLALYVVIYSPIQMACDLPKNYKDQPALEFIRTVGVDWKQSITLNGAVGDYVTIARAEKGTDNWFVGGVTDETSRTISVNFDFLDEGETYEVTIYKDATNAHYKDNPTAIAIEKMEIQKGMTQDIALAAGGGFAISLIKN